jgi:L-seryl-tRNA(Ser) seleniumtransferase
LGKKYWVPVMNDLGSGCLVDLSAHGIEKEPTVQEALETGADVVTFSGDKLLGGPQTGIIVGRNEIIDRVKANPLNRALRIDKLTLAALESTLMLYGQGPEALYKIPALGMLMASQEQLRRRAKRLHRLIRRHVPDLPATVAPDHSRVGGGALPLQALPTWVVAIQPRQIPVEGLETALRHGDTPVIARIAQDRLVLDVRTMQDEEFPLVAGQIAQALTRRNK